ncbi:hypothetical protein CTI12_AA264150 [Artemisia annua]|uniref:Uncharacterized protein n=1 Tax=Artemisia annua TaxID=35608 RepID=A0A2U1NEV5_ARTAN|nr:hypothetical protein CTI12_AA264150 [Artemisia annua]
MHLDVVLCASSVFKAGDMGSMQAEPRLEPKKHRRQSRKKVNQSLLHGLDEALEDDDESYLEDDPIRAEGVITQS